MTIPLSGPKFHSPFEPAVSLASLPRRRLGDELVAVLERSLEDGGGWPCEVEAAPLRGRTGKNELVLDLSP